MLMHVKALLSRTQKVKAFLRSALFCASLFLLSACEVPPGGLVCVEADDWGYPKVPVSAAAADLVMTSQGSAIEVAEWIDSKTVLTGGHLTITTTFDQMAKLYLRDQWEVIRKEDRWTSWYGGEGTTYIDDGFVFNDIEAVPDRECQYKNTKTDELDPAPRVKFGGILSGTPPTCDEDPENRVPYSDCLTPCFLKRGYGLYVMFSDWNEENPSTPLGGVTYHLGDTEDPPDLYSYNDSLDLVESSTGTLPTAGQRLYFKIHDYKYSDNYGGYLVRLKNGVKPADKGILERIVKFFTEPVDRVMEITYKSLVGGTFDGEELPGFLNDSIRAALALYIVIYGFMFLMGAVSHAREDFIKRVLKVSIVIALISDGSWEFFYEHLFVLFTEGLKEAGSYMISGFSGVPKGDNVWESLDHVLRMLFSLETNSKVIGILFADPLGFIYIPFLYVGVFLFIFVLVKALIVYLLAYIGIALLLAISPIFFIFWLFGKLSSLFDEWLSHLIGHCLEQLLLFAAIGMFILIIINFMFTTIGYKVCWLTWWDTFGLYDFKFWLPAVSDVTAAFHDIDLNADGIIDELDTGIRWVDMPYLDPAEYGEKLAAYHEGSGFLNFGDIALFVGSVFLMWKFMDVIPDITDTIKGGGGSGKYDSTSIFGNPGSGASGAARGIGGSGAPGKVADAALGSKVSGARRKELMSRASGSIMGVGPSKEFYRATGRSGGVLGALARSPWAAGRKAQALKNFNNERKASRAKSGTMHDVKQSIKAHNEANPNSRVKFNSKKFEKAWNATSDVADPAKRQQAILSHMQKGTKFEPTVSADRLNQLKQSTVQHDAERQASKDRIRGSRDVYKAAERRGKAAYIGEDGKYYIDEKGKGSIPASGLDQDAQQAAAEALGAKERRGIEAQEARQQAQEARADKERHVSTGDRGLDEARQMDEHIRGEDQRAELEDSREAPKTLESMQAQQRLIDNQQRMVDIDTRLVDAERQHGVNSDEYMQVLVEKNDLQAIMAQDQGILDKGKK